MSKSRLRAATRPVANYLAPVIADAIAARSAGSDTGWQCDGRGPLHATGISRPPPRVKEGGAEGARGGSEPAPEPKLGRRANQLVCRDRVVGGGCRSRHETQVSATACEAGGGKKWPSAEALLTRARATASKHRDSRAAAPSLAGHPTGNGVVAASKFFKQCAGCPSHH